MKVLISDLLFLVFQFHISDVQFWEHAVFLIWDFGIWDLEFGILGTHFWDLGFGNTLSSFLGFGNTGFGIWDLGFEIWDLGFGIWEQILGFGKTLSSPSSVD